MFRDIIIKIEEQNKGKNEPLQAKKLTHEKWQNMYAEVDQEIYTSTKKHFDKAKNNLLKYNISLAKLEDARKQIDLDHANVQKQSRLFQSQHYE